MIFQQAYCIGEIQEDPGKSDITVHGTITDIVDNGKIEYLAAAPADYHFSFSGSGLPFANPEQAFGNTPNKGIIELNGNSFVLRLLRPNAYYEKLGKVLIEPTIYLHYMSGGVKRTLDVKLTDSIPYRLLAYPIFRKGPEFYEGTSELPIRTQEQIIRDGKYPCKNKEYVPFWGLKPRT
jgi:hypothetical protein